MNAPSWFDPGRSPSPVPSTLFTVVNRIREASSDPAYRSFPGHGPMVAGLLVPPFQRGVVWNEERMVRFVDSARRGLPLGTYTVNETYGMEEARRREDGRT